jgi:hypothetical protein
MKKTTKYVLIGAGGLFAWWFVDRNVISLGFPHFGGSQQQVSIAKGLEDAGAILRSGRPAVAILGLHDAGQTLAGRRRVNFAPMRALFGMKGAGQLVAAQQTMAQYTPPGGTPTPSYGSVLQARPDQPPPRDPATTTTTPQSPPPVVTKETAGDKGPGISTPVIVGGLLILLVVLYFIAK